jgi:aminoglycoside 3-N-acetyltransferase
MSEYISFRKIPSLLGLVKGDVVLLSSDIFGLMVTSKKNGEIFDGNVFIDEILSKIGESGTLLLPTFNWDFCHDIPFDYQKTPSATGSLSSIALKRNDFRRTQHPLYSFAVCGKYKDFLCSLSNVSSFGSDSPFAFLDLINAKNVTINVNLTNCFTFVHYIEQRAGVNTYRYLKSFKGQYIDQNGDISERIYSMLVRDIDGYFETDFSPLEKLLEDEAVMKIIKINGLLYRIVNLNAAAPVIMNDIINNRSRSLCKHKWQ